MVNNKESIQNIKNIISNIIPEFKDLEIKIKVSEIGNSELETPYMLSKIEDNKYGVLIFSKYEYDNSIKEYLINFDIPEYDGYILFSILLTYGDIFYNISKSNLSFLCEHINYNELINVELLRLLNNFYSLSYEFNENFNLKMVNKYKFAYKYFPIVLNKLNKRENIYYEKKRVL